MTHDLKIWPIYFLPVLDGRKRFEIRKNDRDFGVGDLLRLREWEPESKEYTGREITVEITYLTSKGQVEGNVVLGIAPVAPSVTLPATDRCAAVEIEGGRILVRSELNIPDGIYTRLSMSEREILRRAEMEHLGATEDGEGERERLAGLADGRVFYHEREVQYAEKAGAAQTIIDGCRAELSDWRKIAALLRAAPGDTP